jgi:teichuronic acid biosynthesis glycosyltransferase TuaC
VRVAVVAEFYPRAEDPVLGVWAHRQAVAARDAGADVRVFVLHRLVPPRADFSLRALRRKLRQPRHAELDGLAVEYVPFVSPPRASSYGSWGAWAARPLARALRRHAFDLVHAHNAVPAGDAVRRAGVAEPLVVSVHGGDVFFTLRRWPAAVERTFGAARLVLANSAGVAQRVRARDVRVVHLGTDVPDAVVAGTGVVTVAHLVARKRHADVIRALPAGVTYDVVGDGPERGALERLARERDAAVTFHGQLEHPRALAVARRCGVFAMPSVDEAFGVAYVEAMAAGLPAIGAAGEPGPEEIARAGEGMRLVPPGDVAALRAAIEECLQAPSLGAKARRTVLRAFTWERCGAATVAAYEEALRA